MTATARTAPAATGPQPPWPGTKADGTAKLEFNGGSCELPMVVGTEGERAIDIAKLRAQTGLITLDEGYVNTGSTTSAITFLDGDKGILRYRGYPIEVLAEKCDFVEVAYLLMFGNLPTVAELDTFRSSLSHHTMLHEDMRSFYGGFPRDAHPMAIAGSVEMDRLDTLGHGVLQVVSDFDLMRGPQRFDAEFDLVEAMARASGRPLSMTWLQRDPGGEQWKAIRSRVDRAVAQGLSLQLQQNVVGSLAVGGLEPRRGVVASENREDRGQSEHHDPPLDRQQHAGARRRLDVRPHRVVTAHRDAPRARRCGR
jgi:hypothetical protein